MELDDIFVKAFNFVANKTGRSDLDRKAALCCLPFPSLALKVLFQNSGLPLGKVIHLVGEEASFKSTLALELIRWHILAGGGGIVLDTESRPLLDTYKAFFKDAGDRFRVVSCNSLEEWEAFLFKYVKYLKDNNINLPVCLVVDSVLGCNSKDTIEKIQKDGFASSRYAVEAKSIADFLRTFVQELMGTPYTLVIINHRKYRTMPGTMIPMKTSLGGGELRFYAAFELELKKREQQNTTIDGVKSYNLSMRTEKNTYGAERITLTTGIKFLPKIAAAEKTLPIYFDWHEATTKLLYDFTNIKPAPTVKTIKTLRNLLDIQMRRGGRRGDLYWSDQLGVPSDKAMTAQELGKLIEEQKDLLKQIEPYLGVQNRYIYDPSLSWEENVMNAVSFDDNGVNTDG